MLGALVAALLVVVAMALLGEYTKTRGRLLLTFLVLAHFCLSAIPPSALLRSGRFQPVGWLGLVASGAGFILVATGIWATPDADAYWKTAAIVSILSAFAFHAGWLLLMTPVGPLASQILRVAMVTSALAVLLAVVGIIGEIQTGAHWWVMFLLLVVSAAGSLGLLVVDRHPKTHAHV
jgi:hypothetical protein